MTCDELPDVDPGTVTVRGWGDGPPAPDPDVVADPEGDGESDPAGIVAGDPYGVS